jgi:membrane peptidoglycan carboxypeptidase
MSDQPSSPTEKIPENPEFTGGWSAPKTPGGWRQPPGQESTDAGSGWRVPTLPTTLDQQPEAEGAWHLPSPEDTIFKPEDVIDIEVPAGEAPAEPAAEPQPLSPAPEDLINDPSLLPFDESAQGQTAAPAAVPTPAADDDDDDFDTFSMSELVALASLVQDAPKSSITPGETPPAAVGDLSALSPAERALLTGGLAATAPASDGQTAAPAAITVTPETPAPTAEDDAAAYARAQLAALQAEADAAQSTVIDAGTAAAAPVPAPAQAEVDDPGAYARAQLAALEASQGATPVEQATAPMPAQEPLDPTREALAQRFNAAESEIRSLRNMYQAGQINRQQLEEQLRGLMILDDDQVWWMMGVETDNWYKFQNGEWVIAEPPRPAGTQATSTPVVPRQNVPTQTSGLDPNQVIAASLPYIDEQSQQTQGSVPFADLTGGVAYNPDAPLPNNVPTRDPNLTQVGRAAVDLTGIRPSEAATLVGGQPVGLDATIPAQAEPTVAYNYVETPIPGEEVIEPPDYDLDRAAPAYEEVVKERQQSTLRTVLTIGISLIVLVLACGAVSALGAAAYYNNLATPWQDEVEALANYEPKFRTARILDFEGREIVEINSQEGGARELIEVNQMSPFVIHAVVALENERFFEDPGYDPVAIARAFIQNLGAGEVESGASTITQQIARNLILQDTTVSAERKLNEIVIAAEIGRRYTKEEILRIYLNEIFFGNQSYGIEAAADFYFDKDAADLNMAEAAMLAGLIQAPATYDPVINREAAFDRMDVVLRRMAEVGCINPNFAPYINNPICINEGDGPRIVDANGRFVGEILVQRAEVEAKEYNPREFQVRYPHFVNFVQAQLENDFGTAEIFRRGFTVRTTLVPRIQDVAQTELERWVSTLNANGINTGSVMVTDPRTGAILAMVGSPDFNNEDIDGQVNGALTWQQPGSAIKPVVYTAALEGVDKNGDGRLDFSEYFTPATILWDVPTTYPTNPPYSPVNFDREFHGPQAVRYALGNSYNVPAVKAYEFIGTDKFIDTATRMGLRFLPEAQFGLPTGIGATEVRLYDMMTAFGTIANNGQRQPLFTIVEITDDAGNPVQLPERAPAAQAVAPEIAFLMQSILTDDQARRAEFGANSGLAFPQFPGLVGAKTGTSNDNRDLWTMGFTHTAVVGVWLGRPDNNPTFNTSGLAAVPIWNATMLSALQGVQIPPFNPAGGNITVPICVDTGAQPGNNCPGGTRNEYFVGSQPPPPADQGLVTTIPIDTWTGLRANNFCPENQQAQVFANIPDQAAVAWLNSPQGQPTAQRLGLPIPFETAPAAACDQNTVIPVARIISPTDGQPVQGQVTVTGNATAQNFNRYQLEVAPEGSDTFAIIAGPFTSQPAGNTLGTFDSTRLTNGVYRLRLAMFANDGGYLYRVIRIIVDNPLPTPTPIPTQAPLPTLPPLASPTPIPFDNNGVGGGQGGGVPTPTATIMAG